MTMVALSGKVVIVIIACISVVVIATIVIPIVVIYSGGETTNGTILAEFRCFSEGILL